LATKFTKIVHSKVEELEEVKEKSKRIRLEDQEQKKKGEEEMKMTERIWAKHQKE